MAITRPLSKDTWRHLKGEAELFKNLADPTRLAACKMLADAPRGLYVGEMVERLDMSQPAVSHHLGLLKKAKIVESERDGKNNLYTLVDDDVRELVAHIKL